MNIQKHLIGNVGEVFLYVRKSFNKSDSMAGVRTGHNLLSTRKSSKSS